MAVADRTARTRAKIMDAAFELFYRQGYEPTAVTEIIKEAGVSKPTFYEHFPSKEELCIRYLEERAELELGGLKAAVRGQKNPLKRFMMPVMAMKMRMMELDYRGCPFFNMLSEVADPASPITKQVNTFFIEFRALVEEVTENLLASDPKKYGDLNARAVVDGYYVLVNGAITSAQEFREEWPFDTAIRLVRKLVR